MKKNNGTPSFLYEQIDIRSVDLVYYWKMLPGPLDWGVFKGS